MSSFEEEERKDQSDRRGTEDLLSLVLQKEMDRDNDEFWDLVRILQYRLAGIFPRIQMLARNQNSKYQDVAATILGQNLVREKQLVRECAAELELMLRTEACLQPEALSSIIFALGCLKGTGFIDAILPYRSHPDADVRWAVTSSLGGCEDDNSINALITLSRDTDYDVRNWATFGLGSLVERDSEEIRNALADRLNESENEVRGEALVGLVKRQDVRAINPLRGEIDLWKSRPLIKDCVDILIDAKEKLSAEWQPVFQDLDRLNLMEEKSDVA